MANDNNNRLAYIEGAFSCWLCAKEFNYEIKMHKEKVQEAHTAAHIGRFFATVFKDAQIRGAFYEFSRRERAFKEFQALMPINK